MVLFFCLLKEIYLKSQPLIWLWYRGDILELVTKLNDIKKHHFNYFLLIMFYAALHETTLMVLYIVNWYILLFFFFCFVLFSMLLGVVMRKTLFYKLCALLSFLSLYEKAAFMVMVCWSERRK